MRKDLTGQRFGRLVAVRATDRRTRDGNVVWELQCDCGNTCEAPTSELLRGRVTSCGCGKSRERAVDLAGQRFGKLVAVRRIGSDGAGCAIWECTCDCGRTCTAQASVLMRGRKRSCGCGRGRGVENVAGQRFGKLEALRPIGRRSGYILWECACDCGNFCHVTSQKLRSGKVTSCGCASPIRKRREAAARHLPIAGQRFGKLVVAGMEGDVVRCVCDCDRVVRVGLDDLRSGAIASCDQCR